MSEGYEALRNGAAWLDLSARGRIVARGRDRARLLHNISTNEIKKLQPGSGCYAFLLTPQGRIHADFWLFAYPDHFLIDTEPELREKVQRHILKYKVADQVELEDVTDKTASIGVEGPGADAIQLPAGDWSTAPFTVTGQPGYRIYAPAERRAEIVQLLEAAGARPATAEDARIVRIENAKPVYGVDIRETTLPQETQQMQAVNFNKGCYIGQEIVERIRAMGQVHRKLERVELESAVEPGTKITVGGREAEITSSVFSPQAGKVIGLAYVRY